MNESEFVPVGTWWTAPLWRKVYLWVRYRPWCWVKGRRAAARQAFALRFPYIVRPEGWVGRGYEDEWDHPDEFHPTADACGPDFDGPHHVCWERNVETLGHLADDWHRYQDAYYRLVRPEMSA